MWLAKPNSSNANQIIENLISNGIIESRERVMGNVRWRGRIFYIMDEKKLLVHN